jgi:plastocyanin
MGTLFRRSAVLVGLVALSAVACDNPGDTAVDDRIVPSEAEASTTSGPSPSAAPSGEATKGRTDLSLVAENFAFSPSELSVAERSDVTIRFENRDTVQHSFSLFPEGSDQKEEAIFLGSPVSGPTGSERFVFPAPEPGAYVFVCPIHPEDMVGSLTVE